MSHRTKSGRLARTLLRVPVPWVFVLTYLVGVGLETAIHTGHFIPNDTLLTRLGSVVFALGAAFAAWGWLIFRRTGTTRVPGEVSASLVTWGPYRWTRNPMYVGLSVAYLGEAAILHQIVPVMLLPLTIVYLNRVVIPVEEGLLYSTFGVEYERYQSEVRRWF